MGREFPRIASRPLDVAEVYDAHADFVWRTLHRLGVETRDLPDLLQDVFVVVHRRGDDHDPTRPLRPWLFGICAGLMRNYRRRAFRKNETLPGHLPELRSSDDPEAAVEAHRRRDVGRRALDELTPEKRAVFVMFEVEGMRSAAIAATLGVPVGTVHSRLSAARRELTAALKEMNR